MSTADFYKGFHESMDQRKIDIAEWVEQLKQDGVRAAHPDDGWVNRDENEVQLVYPYFKHIIAVGDKIALGVPAEYRIVVVKSIQPLRMFNRLFVGYQFVEAEQ